MSMETAILIIVQIKFNWKPNRLLIHYELRLFRVIPMNRIPIHLAAITYLKIKDPQLS